MKSSNCRGLTEKDMKDKKEKIIQKIAINQENSNLYENIQYPVSNIQFR